MSNANISGRFSCSKKVEKHCLTHSLKDFLKGKENLKFYNGNTEC